MFIRTFSFLTFRDTVTSQNIGLSRITLYNADAKTETAGPLLSSIGTLLSTSNFLIALKRLRSRFLRKVSTWIPGYFASNLKFSWCFQVSFKHCSVQRSLRSRRYCWRCKCSGMLRHVDWHVTDFSNDRVAVIFSIKQPRTSWPWSWRLYNPIPMTESHIPRIFQSSVPNVVVVL
jgi:hypothetical protein